MPSPFPGMDPYLEQEALWSGFQHEMILCLYQHLTPQLPDRYRSRPGQRAYTTEMVLFTSVSRIQHHEDYIEIRRRNDGKLVTLVEMASVSNRTTAAGRDAYLATRKEARNAGAATVEIDLVMQGKPTLDFSREGLPEWDHAVAITRAGQPDRYEIFKATLRTRLPRFRLPLAGDDRDLIIDLGEVFTRCFDAGGYAAKIDYSKSPPAKLKDEDDKWMRDLLAARKG